MPDPWMGMLMIELSRMYYSSPLPNCCEMSTEYADVRSPDFQAVIVVDYDNRLFPLTETIPTCLLPVANRKLLAYQLDMLAKSGVAETYIVTPPDYEESLNRFLHEYVRGTMNIDLVVADEMNGTADGLRAVSDRIRGDFFCLTADFISQVSLADLVTLHRSSSSDFTMMLCTPPKDSPMDELDMEYIGLSDEGRVLMNVPALEVEEVLHLSKHLFHRSSSFNLRRDLLDLGIYLMSHWIIEFVKSNLRINSMKSDLMPYLIKRQFQTKEYLYEHMPPIEHRKRPLSVLNSWLTSPSQRQTEMKFQTILDSTEQDSSDLLRCFAIVYEPPQVPSDYPFILNRITSIAGYLNLNKEIPLVQYTSRTPWSKVSNYLKKESSVVGDNVDMGADKSVIFKQCFIGNNCKIGQKTKLNNCVIMDNVIIGDNCTIQNCVICERGIIESNCNLNECNVGSGYKVQAGTRVKGESFASNH